MLGTVLPVALSCVHQSVPGRGCPGPPWAVSGTESRLIIGRDFSLEVIQHCPSDAPDERWSWEVRDTTIATVRPVSNHSAILNAKRIGATYLIVTSGSGQTMAVEMVIQPTP